MRQRISCYSLILVGMVCLVCSSSISVSQNHQVLNASISGIEWGDFKVGRVQIKLRELEGNEYQSVLDSVPWFWGTSAEGHLSGHVRSHSLPAGLSALIRGHISADCSMRSADIQLNQMSLSFDRDHGDAQTIGFQLDLKGKKWSETAEISLMVNGEIHHSGDHFLRMDSEWDLTISLLTPKMYPGAKLRQPTEMITNFWHYSGGVAVLNEDEFQGIRIHGEVVQPPEQSEHEDELPEDSNEDHPFIEKFKLSASTSDFLQILDFQMWGINVPEWIKADEFSGSIKWVDSLASLQSLTLEKILDLVSGDTSSEFPFQASVFGENFEILNYWNGSRLEIETGPGRRLGIRAPFSSLNWENFDELSLSADWSRTPYELSLSMTNAASQIQLGILSHLDRSDPVNPVLELNSQSIQFKFEDTYGLSGMIPAAPSFVLTAEMQGKAEYSLDLTDFKTLDWGMEMSINLKELSFPDLNIELSNLVSKLEIQPPPQTANNLPTITGKIHVDSISIPDLEISPIDVAFKENDQGEPYVILENAGFIGGNFDSAPIFLGGLPRKLAAHFNVQNLDAGHIAELIKDFQGNLIGKLNGQISILWSDPKLRFQYGHFYLNNPEESQLQWDADGILTRSLRPGSLTFNKSREMEMAISKLNLKEMNVFVTNPSMQETLMKIFIHGIPTDGKIRNPVILNLNVLGRWQSLIDYLFKGSALKLDFSVD